MNDALSYGVLFCAHWLGSRRFSKGCSDDFNPEDIQAYRADRKAFLKKNFKVSKKAKVQRQPPPAEAPPPSAPHGPESQSQAAPAPAPTPAPAPAPAPAPGEGEGEGQDGQEQGQGETSPGSSPGSQAQFVQGEEEEVVVYSDQSMPHFVICQCLFCFFLWLVWAVVKVGKGESQGLYRVKAGLDSFNEGTSDLRLAGEDCEDYRFQVWRWLTYQWTHVGLTHVMANVFVIFVLGVPLEGYEGSARTFLLFNAGVLGGAFYYFVNDGHQVVVGCSGGVLALLGVHLADLILNWRCRHFRRGSLALILVLVLTEALGFVLYLTVWTDRVVSYSAPVGGGLAGLLLGLVVCVDADWRYHRHLKATCKFVGGALALFCFIWLCENRAPLNLWESAAGENGYCWVKQVFDSSINQTAWQCVRCGDQSCISQWSQQQYLLSVDADACDSIGWHYDGR